MGLTEDLGSGDVAVDTPVFIYYIQAHPTYLPIVEPLFEDAAAGARTLVSSMLTLLEVLVIPYRAGDLALADQYEALLLHSRGLRMVDVERPHLRVAAQLRAAFRIRTPDALQIAAALSQRCSALVTNDKRLPNIPGLRLFQLDSYVRRAR